VHYRNGNLGSRRHRLRPDRIDSIAIVDLAVPNKSKAFALGRYNTGDGFQQPVYRWNGTAGRAHPRGQTPPTTCPGACGDEAITGTRHWGDVLVAQACRARPAPVAHRLRPKIIEDGSVRLGSRSRARPATAARGTAEACVGQQLWLVGATQGKRRIMARDCNHLVYISSKGLPAAATSGLSIESHGNSSGRLLGAHRSPHHLARSLALGGGNLHATEDPPAAAPGSSSQ